MRTLMLSLVVLAVSSTETHAALRTWKDRKGNEVKAEFTGGVLQNKLVLKAAGNRRIYVRLSDLSLEDRDYIVEELTARDNPKDLEMLNALMLFENQVPFIDPDAPKAKPNTGLGSGNDEPDPEASNPFNPLENPNAINQPMAEMPTEMYGLPLPSPELLGDDPVRTWTSLTGLKQIAQFDRLLAPGFLRLKKADGTKGTFALVNFSKADIDYVKEALQKDMAREIFPEGNGFQSLTPEDIGKGYKVWTDRKNVPLIGKFIGVKSKNVVIEVGGEEREYPKAGLSQADIDWVDAEVKRRAEAAQATARAAAQEREANARNRFTPYGSTGTGESDSGGHDEGTGNRFGPRNSFGISYTHTCTNCGKTWTDSSPLSHCPDCAGKYHFSCPRCGHKWTSTDSIISQCPQCTAERNASASNNSASSTRTSSSSTTSPTNYGSGSSSSGGSGSGSGVLMTIVYVAMGVVLLGGIAAGLFKAFG